MPSKKKHTKKSVSKNSKHTAKASANSSPMNSNHSVEYCGICRNKVKVSNITFVDLRVKNGTIRKRMIYLCENRGHEWGKFVSSKTKTNNTSISNKNSLMRGGAAEEWNPSHTGFTTARSKLWGETVQRKQIPIRKSVALETAEREAQENEVAQQKYNKAQQNYEANIEREIERLEIEKEDTKQKIEAKKRAENKKREAQIQKAQEEKARLEENKKRAAQIQKAQAEKAKLEAELRANENATKAAAAAQNATKAAQDDSKPEEPEEPEETDFEPITFVNPPPIPFIHSNSNESNA